MSLCGLARKREEDQRKEDERRYPEIFLVAHRCTCPQTKSHKASKIHERPRNKRAFQKGRKLASQAVKLGLGGLTETIGQDSTVC